MYWLIIICILPFSLHGKQLIYKKSVYSLPLTLDPIKMNDTASLLAGNLIYDGLVRFAPSLRIEPAIAESWIFLDDGKTITFKIRENAKFHNGASIKVADVVFSLKRNLSAESLTRNYFDCVLGWNESGFDDKMGGIKATSIDTVEIKLKYPNPNFLNILAGATAKIISKAEFEQRLDYFDKPIGSGPFSFHSLEKENRRIRLDASKAYYRKVEGSIDQLWLIESDEKTAISLAKNGKIDDLTNWPISGASDVFKTGQKISAPVNGTWIIGLNTKLPPFNNKSVRQTFKRDFDTSGFRAEFYPDSYSAVGYVPPGLPGSSERSKAEASENKVSKLKIEIAIPRELEKHDEMKQFIEKMLTAKGWNVQVTPLKWDELMSGYSNKRLQSFLVAMNMDYPDPEFLYKNFESNNKDNFSGLSDKEIDQLNVRLRAEPDRLKKIPILNLLRSKIEDQAVTVNLFHPRGNYWVSRCVKGFKPNIISDVYIDYAPISKTAKCKP